MIEQIGIETIDETKTFGVVFTRNGIEYDAVVQSDYIDINGWTNKEILNIQLDGSEVELNLTDSEEQEILDYCE